MKLLPDVYTICCYISHFENTMRPLNFSMRKRSNYIWTTKNSHVKAWGRRITRDQRLPFSCHWRCLAFGNVGIYGTTLSSNSAVLYTASTSSDLQMMRTEACNLMIAFPNRFISDIFTADWRIVYCTLGLSMLVLVATYSSLDARFFIFTHLLAPKCILFRLSYCRYLQSN